MNTKSLNLIFALVAVVSSAFAIYAWSRVRYLEKETENWKAKYEEAIIDAEEAVQRVEKMEEELKNALMIAEKERKEALLMLEQMKQGKAAR